MQVRASEYRVAVTVAFGRFSDAIVTDDQETAKQCIEYLKRNKLFRMEFIPLQNVKFKKQNADLRQLGTLRSTHLCIEHSPLLFENQFKLVASTLAGTRFVTDLLDYKDFLEPALLYSVGNVLVCDDQAVRLNKEIDLVSCLARIKG